MRDVLWKRQRIVEAIRRDLYNEDFLEVETPLLVKGTCPDVHIESMQVGDGYLITSTEYQIKRLMAEGFTKVFTLTKNFRAHDTGRYHSPEFTMLEWARTNVSLESIEEDAIRFIRKALFALKPDGSTICFNNHIIDLAKPWQRLTVRDAFKIHLGLEDLQDFSLEALLRAIKKTNISIPQGFEQDKYLVLSYLFEQLQGHLGLSTPTFLQKWPAYLTTSAPISQDDPDIAERSELYIGGIEVADGFPFLCDATLQRKLFAAGCSIRKSLGKPPVTIDEKYLETLDAGLPPGAGMALGIDRLVMILTGSKCLADVQSFTWDTV